MFDKTEDDSLLETAITHAFEQMSYEQPHTEEYGRMVDNVSKLYLLKEVDKPKRISPDTLATILANLAGIVVIVGHEQMHVITSKALNFVLKLR